MNRRWKKGGQKADKMWKKPKMIYFNYFQCFSHRVGFGLTPLYDLSRLWMPPKIIWSHLNQEVKFSRKLLVVLRVHAKKFMVHFLATVYFGKGTILFILKFHAIMPHIQMSSNNNVTFNEKLYKNESKVMLTQLIWFFQWVNMQIISFCFLVMFLILEGKYFVR